MSALMRVLAMVTVKSVAARVLNIKNASMALNNILLLRQRINISPLILISRSDIIYRISVSIDLEIYLLIKQIDQTRRHLFTISR